jgi:hypothetical protein
VSTVRAGDVTTSTLFETAEPLASSKQGATPWRSRGWPSGRSRIGTLSEKAVAMPA